MTRKITTVARLLLSVLLVISIAIPTGAYIARAEGDDITALDVKVTYGQTSARTMLDMINRFRASTSGSDAPDGAWYWNEDDATKTVFNTNTDNQLQPLVYDYDLERAAMQRAAEIALYFHKDHLRPDDSSCFTVLEDLAIMSGYTGYGENIAAGPYDYDAEDAFVLLREDEDDHEHQGHRRNMLNPNFNAIGIARVTVNGVDYWVQELGRTSKTTAATPANDQLTDVSLKVKTEYLQYNSTVHTTYDEVMDIGQVQPAPRLITYLTTPETYGYGMPAELSVLWTSSVPSVADVTDGAIVAKNAGSTVLSAALPASPSARALPASYTIPVTVQPINISGSDVKLEYSEIEYTGNEMKPKITSMTLSGTDLDVSDSDCFVVSYSDNVQTGTGKVSVTGKGNYTGSVTQTFTIKPCQHVFDAGTVVSAADCTNDGVKKFECTKCDFSKTEAIKATGHTPGAAATCTTDQTCTVCKAVIKAKLGHTPKSGSFICTADQTCSVCNEVYHKAGSHTPGPAATCTTEQTCTVCKTVLAEKAAHTPGDAATCTTDQTCTVCKAVVKQKTGHTAGAAATCGTDQKCTVCNTVLNAATGKHTAGAAATCNNPQKCTVCGAVIAKATGKHTDANNDTKCDVCGYDMSGKGPTTGEIIRSNLPVIIAAVLAVVSATAIIIVIAKQRKNKNSR